MTRRIATALFVCATVVAGACGSDADRPAVTPIDHVLLITIDTLRADYVGAYGGTAARTPALDSLARDGVRAARAFATAPITLTSHASLLTGLYPPGHGARHNGIAIKDTVPTLATMFQSAGFATGAFVSAFPLDRRFGLARGFDRYDDELQRDANGQSADERSGDETVTRALAWLDAHGRGKWFLWVHLFEPHAPYGAPGSRSGGAAARYAEDVETADREVGRLLSGIVAVQASTLVVAAADHGEAFGEHGELSHSLFVYDTTLQVPLLMRGPGITPGSVIAGDVSLVDVAPTILALTARPKADVDGQSLVSAFGGAAIKDRALYAESFAPQFDFGWAGLRTMREGRWKYIAAPRPELYDTAADSGEAVNRIDAEPAVASALAARARGISPPDLEQVVPVAGDTRRRLQSLGYLAGGPTDGGGPNRPDPKDRVALAARIARVTSGEVTGDALIETLRAILRDDPRNPQAHLRLGFAELARDRCQAAEPHFSAALGAGLPSADAGIGLAACRGRAGDLAGARAALDAARAVEPGNPVVAANLGLLALAQGRVADAVTQLRTALARDPGLLEARFALARALGRSGDRASALVEATILLSKLPYGAPQRAEVERLIASLR